MDTFTFGDRVIRNAIEEAIYVALGGVRAAAAILEVSTQALYQLLGAELVRNRETAVKIHQATLDAGHEVPAAELMNLAPWRGAERHPSGGAPAPRPSGRRSNGGGSGERKRVRPAVAAAAQASMSRVVSIRSRLGRRVSSRSCIRIVGSQAARG